MSVLTIALFVAFATLLSPAVSQREVCSDINQCSTLSSCNAAVYSNTASPAVNYMICCLPKTVGPSTTFGDGTGCGIDKCTLASTCKSDPDCVPVPYATSVPALTCVSKEKLCWSQPQELCKDYCVWNTASNGCFWGLNAQSTPVPVTPANPCPTINTFVLIMLIFMFVSLVGAIVTVAVVVVVNQRKAEREALEEEAAEAEGGVQL
jgi:hypothetical protein